MIFETLNCLTEELNEFFRSKLKIMDNKVILSSLINLDGTVGVPDENKVVITLVNLEREPVANAGAPLSRSAAGHNGVLNVNLHILFSSYFSSTNYPEGLKFLSMIIGFFQRKPVFTPANTPGLDQGIERLMLEMESPGLERTNNLWATIGAKYLPSVLYKVRMLSFGGDQPDYIPIIKQSDYAVGPSAV